MTIITQVCKECGHVASVQSNCKMWACAECTLIQAVKIRMTVQVLNMIDGEAREVVAHVPAANEQDAVDKLFALARDEMAYRFLGRDGVISPSSAHIPPFTTKYASGEWFAKV